MADTTEVLRLMRHAADRLAEEKQRQPHAELLRKSIGTGENVALLRQAASLNAALTLGETVLRMVAAFMTDEPAGEPPNPDGEAS